MIFFYDKHWYHSEALQTVTEEDEEDEEEEDESSILNTEGSSIPRRVPSPTPSQETVTSAPVSSHTKKPEYEFILFNYLLRFVHREGKIGELARAGLLFLMDVAMSPGVPVHRLAGDDLKSSTSSVSAQSSDPIADAALALAEYILDGDFCEVLGAGLGAVYSLLPSKLEVRLELPPENGAQAGTMTIGSTGPLSVEEKEKQELTRERARAVGLEYSTSPEFKARLDHFVKLLEFLQDVLRRNVASVADDGSIEPTSFVGSAIVQSILDAVRRIFLENVLYPSILECSDTDGSAVAVMSYIDVMVRSLHEPQFAETLIDFLVSEDDTESSRRRHRIRPTLLLDSQKQGPPQSGATKETKRNRRRSSAMMLLEMEAPDARKQSEYLTSMGRFTLKDLLLTNMRSRSLSSMTAAMQLMQSLLVHHCHLTVDRLFIFSYESTMASSPPTASNRNILSDDEDEEIFTYPGSEIQPTSSRIVTSFAGPELVSRAPEATYTMHERELGMYLALVARIDSSNVQGAFSTGYDHYLRDALTNVANHACSKSDEVPPKHSLDVNDPLLSLVLQSLRHFYSNTPELNMALTGMLAAIASCPERGLRGWLLFGSEAPPPKKAPTSNAHLFDDGDDRSVDFDVNDSLSLTEPPLPILRPEPLSQPVVLSILQGLVSNVDRFRNHVQDFDALLNERRQGLIFSENLTDALSLTFDLSQNITGIVNSPQSSRSPVAPSTPQTPPPKPKAKSKASAWASLLTPRKNRSRAVSPSPSDASSPAQVGKAIEASPFGSHYRKTNAITVEPLVAPMPTSGVWAPVEQRSFNIDEENVFSSSGQWGDESSADLMATLHQSRQEQEGAPDEKQVSLSQLLDNVVVLEESIKELTAIIHARRSLGIDTLSYL